MRAAACGAFGKVEGTLAKFAGRESALFDALVAKYGLEPGAGGSGGGVGAGAPSGAASSAYPPEVGAAPKAFSFSVPKPSPASSAAPAAASSAADGEAPPADVRPRRSSDAAADLASAWLRARVVALYRAYNPTKMAEVRVWAG